MSVEITPTFLFRVRRFFREMKHPEERCARLGCFEEIETREGFTKTNSSWRVADRVKQERVVCWRCGKVIRDWETKHREGLQGLSMPTRCFDEMRETGFTKGE